jgi:hypothetical protein
MASSFMLELALGRISANPRGELDAGPDGVEDGRYFEGVLTYLGLSGVLEKGMYFWSGPRPAGLERE